MKRNLQKESRQSKVLADFMGEERMLKRQAV